MSALRGRRRWKHSKLFPILIRFDHTSHRTWIWTWEGSHFGLYRRGNCTIRLPNDSHEDGMLPSVQQLLGSCFRIFMGTWRIHLSFLLAHGKDVKAGSHHVWLISYLYRLDFLNSVSPIADQKQPMKVIRASHPHSTDFDAYSHSSKHSNSQLYATILIVNIWSGWNSFIKATSEDHRKAKRRRIKRGGEFAHRHSPPHWLTFAPLDAPKLHIPGNSKFTCISP